MSTSPSELISLFFALFALAFAIFHFHILSDRRYNMFFLALYSVVVGLVATVLEPLAVPELLNFIEHAGFAVGAILVAVGCRRITNLAREE